MLGKILDFASFFKHKRKPPDAQAQKQKAVFKPDFSIMTEAPVLNRPVDFATVHRTNTLFFTPETEDRDFQTVLSDVQAYISENHSALITAGGEDARAQLKRYINKYLQDHRVAVNGLPGDALADALYTEMAEYGFLTKYIFSSGIEEINSATRS